MGAILEVCIDRPTIIVQNTKNLNPMNNKNDKNLKRKSSENNNNNNHNNNNNNERIQSIPAAQVENQVAINRGFSDWSFLGDFINDVQEQIDNGDLVQNLEDGDYQEINSILSD